MFYDLMVRVTGGFGFPAMKGSLHGCVTGPFCGARHDERVGCGTATHYGSVAQMEERRQQA